MDDAFLSTFRDTIETSSEKLLEIPEAESEKPMEGGWSAKQILGHLIDSAANNHSRFVRAQLQEDLVFEGYAQEDWVRVEQFDKEAWAALVDLWSEYNLHLLHIISNIPDSILNQPRTKHSLDKIAWQTVPASEPATLDYFIRDYFGHLQDHLKQIYPGVTNS